MKKISFLMAALLVAMVGCQKEPQANEEAQAGSVYMTFEISVPTTKSQTDSEGSTNSNANPEEEVGFDRENKISTVDIFLENNTTGLKVFSDNVSQIVGSKTYYSASFDLDSFTDGDYNVYVVCNGDANTTIQSVHETYTLSNEDLTKSIAKDNFFLMTNAKISQSVNIVVNNMIAHTVPTNPFNLGEIEVERAAARFDYRAAKPDNKYQIDEAGKAGAGIQLTHAAMINSSKAFYYFKRVSTDGTNEGWTVCGKELSTNYVVDTDFELKNNAAANLSALKANFFDYMDTKSDWNWTALTTLQNEDNLGAVKDKTDDPNNTAYDGYYIWRYAAENTIPGTKNQINGVTTGVVFKGILIDNKGDAIQANEDKDPVFVHNNVYYGTWNDIETLITDNNAPFSLIAAYEQVKNSTSTTKHSEAGFTVYYPNSEGQFEVLYYYWNRHNNNGKKDEMGPMEFAVVRNNVYKLAVTKINQFGIPNNGTTPDVPETTDPDETLNYYFQVSVKVLPWTVRVNDIEF